MRRERLYRPPPYISWPADMRLAGYSNFASYSPDDGPENELSGHRSPAGSWSAAGRNHRGTASPRMLGVVLGSSSKGSSGTRMPG